ncbi:MAG: BamA/TamA family outer membrane protein [Candidatus Eisenbacteria bacterium]|nr:BamA/TamA family outer membrane protein [Candidatus Eisenbacteria bacterium]
MRHHVTAAGLACRTTLAILAGLLAVPTGVQAQYFGKNKVHYDDFDWKILKTEHFEVYYYEEEAETAKDAARMAERSYVRLAHVLRHQFRKPIPLVLYATHGQFQQTNILQDLIDEGTGGVTEFAKQRVFLPFTGSYSELEHVLSHELVHAFQIDILYGKSQSFLSNPFTFQPPGWFMEGMAEYLSLGGVDPNTEMWLKDGALQGYLIPIETLDYAYDIRVYRFGQSIWEFIARQYGEERVGDLLRRTGATRNVGRSIEFVLGVTVEKLSDDWLESVRLNYLPQVARYQRASDFGRRLTRHEKNQTNYNVVPAVSPTGDKMTYISDRGLSTGLYLASAIDGKELGQLAEGERRADFESFRFFTSSADWHPDGRRVILPAKSGPRDVLYLFDTVEKKDVGKLEFEDIDAITSPCWSPDGSRLVFSGERGGTSDLYLCDANGSNLIRLTEDKYADRQPRWSPDGTRIVFVTDRGPGTDFDRLVFDRYRLAMLTLETTAIDTLPAMAGKNITPYWSADGKEVLFVSDRTGINNLFVLNLENGIVRQISDLLTGVSGITEGSPPLGVSRDGRRAVFSSFEKAGWDLFAVKDPFLLPAIVAPEPGLPIADGATATGLAMKSGPPVPGQSGGLGRVAMSLPPVNPAPPDSGSDPKTPPVDWRALPTGPDGHGSPMDPGIAAARPDSAMSPEVLDSLRVAMNALPDPLTFQRRGYRAQFSTDYASTQAAFGTSNGLAGLVSLSFSDMLGNRNILVAAGIYGSLLESDLLVQYIDQSDRNNYGGALFQFRNDYFLVSRPFEDEYETVINRGGEFFVSRPFDKFHRMELGVAAVSVKARRIVTNFEDETVISERPTYFYAEPRLAWVRDTAIYGSVGPIGGARSRVSLNQAFGGIQRTNLLVDYRIYQNFARRYALAWRVIFANSAGKDPVVYRVGGPFTVRSVDYGEIEGSHAAFTNIELRVPFIDRLATAFPLALEWPGIRGAIFLDMGAGWGRQGDGQVAAFHPFSSDQGFHLDSLRAAFGFGLRMNMGFLILRYDVAQPTNFQENLGSAIQFFSIGADF